MTQNSKLITQNNKHRKPNLTKYILVTFILLFLCSGILFILRGYFLDKDQLFDNSNLISNLNEVVKFNNPIKKDSTPSNNNKSIAFGENIKNPFRSSNSKFWLIAKNNLSNIVGYLDSDGNFNTVYSLPNNVRAVNLYEDDSITFILNENNTDTLFSQLPGQDSKEILALPKSQSLVSSFFDPESKVFYFTIQDEDEITFIDSMDLNLKRSEIYSSDLLKQDAQVLFANSTNLWFKSSNSCYVLKFFDKSVGSIDCKFVRSTFDGVKYTSNANSSNTYGSFITGEIFQINQSTQSEASFFKGAQGEIFTNLHNTNSGIILLKSRLNNNSGIFTSAPDSINLLSNGSLNSIANRFPAGDIGEIRFDGKNLYLTIKDSSGKFRIFKYKEPQPSSYLVSTDFWLEVKLGITSVDELKFI